MQLFALPRRLSFALAMCVCLVFAALPPGVAQAALTIPRPITNDVSEFTTGEFQRTQLSSLRLNELAQDRQGASQLVPIGLFRFNNTASSKLLPYQLARMGVATVGNRIFVIGGIANGPKRGTSTVYNSQTVGEVYSAAVSTTPTTANQIQGDLVEDWQVEPVLPTVQSGTNSVGTAVTTNVVHSPAVTSVTIGGRSYIYVIGGNTRVGTSTLDFSSYAVQIASLDSNSRITSWAEQAGARVPAINGDVTGIQGASAVTMTINGVAYVFVLGGVQRFQQGGTNLVEIGSKAVFYARVDPATGKLFKPSAPTQEGWDRMTNDLPIQSTNQNAGIWDAAAVAGQYNINSDEGVGYDRVIYLFGGQLVSQNFNGRPAAVYNSRVYQVYVSSSADSGLTIGQPVNGDYQNGVLPEARVGLGAVTFGGKHYLTGGLTPDQGGTVRSDMLTTYVQDSLEFPQFGGQGGGNFLRDDDAIGKPRAFHGMAIVPLNETAFVYLLGGQSNSLNTNPTFSDEIIFGKIGGQESTEIAGYPKDGWYYGKPVEFQFRNAEVQEVNWGTLITDSTELDVELYYRVSSANDCSAPGWSVDDWVQIDGNTTDARYSRRGANTVSILNADGTPVQARCFQYRARLVGSQSPDANVIATQTPSLLYVSLLIRVPGSPDVRADKPGDIDAKINPNGQLTALNIQVRNKNDSATDPTLDVNAELKGGSFFVDLFIYKDGESFTPPTYPVTGSSPNHIGCASISKADLPADGVRPIVTWFPASDTTDCRSGTPVTVLDSFASLFQSRGEGKYIVYVVVDSNCGSSAWGCVDERDAPSGEENNVARYEFTVDLASGVTRPVSYNVQLPLVSR